MTTAKPKLQSTPTGATNELTACEAARAIAAGELTSEALVGSCLGRIAERDETVRAWAFLDPDYALEQARAADELRRSGQPIGPLHGVPVGLKDIIDTSAMPCENGTALDAGRQPERDATIVSLLREAGAVIMGKTVTTELAFYHPSKTRNPLDPDRTPGGSSSGSAAAVADRMVPLAIGTQTNGSMIRPASFCGVFGFKPSFGLISRHGLLTLSPPLDTVGAFARTLNDAALLCDALIGYDPNDASTAPRARARLLEGGRSVPPVSPQFAFVKSPVWDQADADTKAGFAELMEALGDACDEVELPEVFDQAHALQYNLMAADMARYLAPYEKRGAEQLGRETREALSDGRKISAIDYTIALDGRQILNAGLEAIFERFDAIITPAACGEAPIGLEATGDPVFSTLWTYCGVPALSLPLLTGDDGLPIGVQVVGRRFDDARLLRTANWLTRELAS